MSLPSEQLEAIYQELQASFERHPQIVITPINGSPPEQYRVTYHLQGLCTNADGVIQRCSQHSIVIQLPFGFPHFPPNCKPESPIFHPNFDQAAICIGEFWETSNSLSELILHIGRMLCGEICSIEHAFNKEASIWYQDNKKELPFDTLSLPSHASFPTDLPLPADVNKQSEASLNEMEVATVDDDFFIVDQNENDIEKEPFSRQGQSFSESFSVDRSYYNRHDANQKHQQAESYEYQGEPVKALELYREIKELLPDYPGIDDDIKRAEYSIEMLGDFATDDENGENLIVDMQKNVSQKSRKTKISTSQESPPKIKWKLSQRQIMIIGSGAGFALIAFLVTYFSLNSQYNKAQSEFTECQALSNAKSYIEAQEKCAAALESTNAILLVKQEQKKNLQDSIAQIQDSEDFKTGVADELTVRSQQEAASGWEHTLEEADQLFEEKKWRDAIVTYTRALQLTSSLLNIDKAVINHMRGNIAIAEFHDALQAGEQALKTDEWETARKHLHRATEMAKKNPTIPPADIVSMNGLIAQIDFNNFMTAGEKSFAKGEWTEALASFEQAFEQEKKHPFAPPETLLSLRETMVKTKIYTSLEQGKKSFADSQWDQAITHYENAIQLLKDNNELLQGNNPQHSQHKIAKLMLRATVIRDTQQSAVYLKSKEYVSAVDILRSTIATINKSPFAGEQEFKALIKDAQESLEQAQNDLTINEHIAYLTENYKQLFMKNNPSLHPDNLSSPKILFLRTSGNQSFYKIQCIEQGQGRPILLRSTYIYNFASRTWSFSSNDSSSNEGEAELKGQQILAQAAQSQDKRIKDEQIDYLIKNFQKFCLHDNPQLLQANVSRPTANFLKKIDDKMLFQLKCQYQEAEKKTSLSVNCLYDPVSSQWEFPETKKGQAEKESEVSQKN